MSKRDKYIIWAVIVFCGFVLAIVCRYVALRYETEAGTANLIFIGVLAGFPLAYWLFSVLWESIWEIATRKRKTKGVYRPELPENSPLRSKVDTFIRYTDEVLNGYVSEDDLPLLHTYIQQYAQGNIGDIPKKIRTNNAIDTFELAHYGWNIWNHFDRRQQSEAGDWLKNVFITLENYKADITKKFKHDERATYVIPIEPNIK